MSKKASRHSLTIRSKLKLARILDASSSSIRMEINEAGHITGKYTGTQISTVETTANQDGSSSWTGKFLHMTNKGDVVIATGSGKSDPPNAKGINKIHGEGQMWTQSPKLSHLNGAAWTCEGEGNMLKGTSIVKVNFQENL